MDDKDRMDEARGAEDALRPERPGGERKGPGETDQRPDPANAIPLGSDSGGVDGTASSRGRDERASGMIDDPISTGDRRGPAR
jgi:hypothetical protein